VFLSTSSSNVSLSPYTVFFSMSSFTVFLCSSPLPLKPQLEIDTEKEGQLTSKIFVMESLDKIITNLYYRDLSILNS
jgi:hypothetical protein